MDELMHHGVKGMKWGVRRFQNSDGSLTPKGRQRYSGKESSDGQSQDKAATSKKIARTVALSAVTTMTVAAAATYVAKNPEKVKNIVSQAKSIKVGELSKQAVQKGKNAVKIGAKNAYTGAKEGAKEAIKEAPKKATKAIVAGVILNQAKQALDKAVGKEESARIFQANDNKKIGKFWKVNSEDEDKD